ncbi:MAG: hypothetical protein V4525_10225 [Pseudomonadota bacterium]
MTLINFIILLVVSGIVGSIGQAIAGFSRGGFLVACAIGFIGAALGVYLSKYFHLPELFVINVAGNQFPIIWSIIGSTVFMIIVGLITRRTT